ALEQKENAAILFKAIDRLPDNQKTAIVLSLVEELPQKEISEIMKLSVGAVESLIQRAKANLRKDLENFYPDRRK
ncbi:MAG TPA: RNA polymerase sigma factor, partial [Cyclobacteriaceae bacterium]|nr:RNA polymerase sigma factor [Cyclobacteriaceae bacterium]